MTTLCGSVKASRPIRPPSRPIPDCLKPPKGAPGALPMCLRERRQSSRTNSATAASPCEFSLNGPRLECLTSPSHHLAPSHGRPKANRSPSAASEGNWVSGPLPAVRLQVPTYRCFATVPTAPTTSHYVADLSAVSTTSVDLVLLSSSHQQACDLGASTTILCCYSSPSSLFLNRRAGCPKRQLSTRPVWRFTLHSGIKHSQIFDP